MIESDKALLAAVFLVAPITGIMISANPDTAHLAPMAILVVIGSGIVMWILKEWLR